ncbi:3D domain-containing protein [Bacillus cereus]|uniref:3D domain-containing protein n=1 Tax=Bacillus cereus TaxID=1396 RepID=UPI000DE5BB95|nr:3D domain-containing protein [Bacillus cereus]
MRKRIVALTIAMAFGLGFQPNSSLAETSNTITQAAPQQTGWQSQNGKWFYYQNGSKKTGWLSTGGKWYYLDAAAGGAMKMGWLSTGGSWYYLDAAAGGAMKTGWTKIDAKMNYFKGSGQWVNARELTVRSTAYSNDPVENGAKPGQHVYTRMGDDLTANPNLKVIAVDPSVIPLGSNVYVEGYGAAAARDTGGAIKGNKIDVFIASKQAVWNWGVRTVKVYVLP